jgi:small-conductance mechanosensitive channel
LPDKNNVNKSNAIENGANMKKKNPLVAAILNLILPGIGFAYLGSAALIVAGIVLFVSSTAIEIIYYKHTVGMVAKPSYWVWSILGALALAAITFVLTRIFNKGIQEKGENLPEKNL